MIELSERLVKAAMPKINEVFHRQYFPVSMNVRITQNTIRITVSVGKI